MSAVREKFATQVDAELLESVRQLARSEGRQNTSSWRKSAMLLIDLLGRTNSVEVAKQALSAARYLLTPRGIKARARITARYLQRKMDEFEALKTEIDDLKAELGNTTT